MRAKILFPSVLFFIATIAHAQSINTIAQNTREKDENPDSITWIKKFEGKIALYHDIEMTLAFDGEKYHGYYTLMSNGTRFEIEGYREADRLILQETDVRGNTCGYLVGELAEDRFTGKWWSHDYTRSAELRLLKDELIELRKFDPGLFQLSGTSTLGEFDLTLFVESPEWLTGSIYFQTLNMTMSVHGMCRTMRCDDWILSVESTGTYADLEFRKAASDKYTVHFRDSISGIGQCRLNKKWELSESAMYCNAAGRIDGMYPVTD